MATPSSYHPISSSQTASRSRLIYLLLLIPFFIFLCIFYSFPFSSSSSSLPTALRSAPYPPINLELPTGFCFKPLSCQVTLKLELAFRRLHIGLFIYSDDPDNPYLEVPAYSKYRIAHISKEDANRWALLLFEAIHDRLPSLKDEDGLIHDMADAILDSKTRVQFCSITSSQRCKFDIKVEPDFDDDESDCGCPYYTVPVCGKNGKNYPNACIAKCKNMDIACLHKCPCETCEECDNYDDPVCGEDGFEYQNECKAQCVGVRVDCRGQCPCPRCPCPKCLNEVCGVDGKTYGNICLAECSSRVQVSCRGKCPCEPECGCGTYYRPVCGRDGRTYENLCVAYCRGITAKKYGHCLEDDDDWERKRNWDDDVGCGE